MGARTKRVDKTEQIFKNLSMTNEEKILRKNYGANYDSQVQLMDRGSSLQLNRKMGHRKVSTATKQRATSRGPKAYNDYSVMQGQNDSPPPRGTMDFRENYYSIMNRSAQRVQKVNQCAENRQKAVHEKELAMAKKNKELEKLEKEAKKKAKERFFAEEIKKEKAAERRQAAQTNKKAIDKEYNDKMRQMGRELERKMGGYGVGPMPVRNQESEMKKPVAE